MQVPFTKPSIGQSEIDAVVAALQAGDLGGNGRLCWQVQGQLRELTGAEHVLLAPSATLAAEIAFVAIDLGPGDEVIMPSFSFVSLANLVVARGATPVFCEIDEDTLNLDPADVARRITEKTRAIMPVHYAGVACDIEACRALADEHDLFLLEDAAQALGSRWKGQHLGTLGDAGCISFHETKNAVCGEGGALLLRSADLMRRAEVVHEKGTNRSEFMRGNIERYTWIDQGGSYVMSDLLAALLGAQLERLDALNATRHEVWKRYDAAFAELEAEDSVRRSVVPEGAEHNAHLYALRTRTPEARNALLEGLHAEGIQATFHFQPLHASTFAREKLGLSQSLPISERVADTLVRLPLWTDMQDDAVDHVISNVRRLCRTTAVGGASMRKPNSRELCSGGSSREFVDALHREALSHAAANHEYLARLAKGQFPQPRQALRDFAFQYDGYTGSFLHFLESAMKPLADAGHRAQLSDNLSEERGIEGAPEPRHWPHRILYRHFQNAVGVDEQFRNERCLADAAMAFRDGFLSICGSPKEGVGIGAIGLATETIVPALYAQVLQALHCLEYDDELASLFFVVHAECDEGHAEVLEAITCDLADDIERREAIRSGVYEALALREAFFDAMLERAERMAPE